jgi:hypothetical protein
MNGPKCESDSRGGIKFGDESGARLTFDGIISTAKIPHGNKFFDRFRCCLSLPKRIPQIAPLNINFPIKFCKGKNRSGNSTISGYGPEVTVLMIITIRTKRRFVS